MLDKLGAIIKEARLKSGLSELEFRRLTKITTADLMKIEKGEYPELTIAQLIALSDTLGIPAWELMEQAQAETTTH